MLTVLENCLVTELREARRAFGLAAMGDGETSPASAGRRYLAAKNALIDDILRDGEIETPTHRYSVRWDADFRRWRLVITPFVFFAGWERGSDAA